MIFFEVHLQIHMYIVHITILIIIKLIYQYQTVKKSRQPLTFILILQTFFLF